MNNQIPPYLGLGILDPKSIIETETESTAEYCMLGKMICKLTLTPRSALIEDYCEGKLLDITKHINLPMAVEQHFQIWRPKEDPRFKILHDRVCELGNVYFEYPPSFKDCDDLIVDSPTGRWMIIRIPLPTDSDDYLDKFMQIDPSPNDEVNAYSFYESSYLSTLISSDELGIKQKELISMFEFKVPLAYVYQTAKWFKDHGFIHPDKRFRMIIQDFKLKHKESIKTFQSVTQESWKSYSLHFKRYDINDKDFEEADLKLWVDA